MDDGIVAEALEVLEISEVTRLLAGAPADSVFSAGERDYAASKSDPERRLAARLAAKRAASRALGGGVEPRFASWGSRGVHYVFPHLIPFTTAGRLPVDNRDPMRAFLAAARRVAPEVKILPWVGGLRVGYKRQRPGTVDLGDLGQRQRIV